MRRPSAHKHVIGRHVCACLALCAAFASDVGAQVPVEFQAAGAASLTRLNRTGALDSGRQSGLTVGGTGRLAVWRVGVDLRYQEGGLDRADGTAGEDFVEGEVLLGVDVLPWLAVKAGPHVRSLITERGTQRWLFFEGRLRAEARVFGSGFRSYLELWRVLSADVDLVEPYGGGEGFEGGLRYEVGGTPLWLECGYRIDRSRLEGTERRDTVEHTRLAVGFTIGR